jgi:CRP/FNR family cyclic AMP-dependent transcriptional regulator
MRPMMRRCRYLLGILSDSDIDWLRTRGRRQAVPEGAVIIREGEMVGAVFVLLEGRLGVLSPEGEAMHVLLPGELFGEVSFVDSRPPIATVVALEPATILRVDAADLRVRLERDVAFCARFYRALATFLADRLRSRVQMEAGEPEAGSDVEPSPEMREALSVADERVEPILRQLLA